MNIDVLLMGSSHMQGYYAQTEEITSSLLENISGLKVYNIGASDHDLLSCACNLEAAVKKYRPSKYIIMQTGSLKFSNFLLQKALDNTLPEIDVVNRGKLRLLVRKNKYLRLLWNNFKKITAPEKTISANFAVNDPELLNELFARISKTASLSGAKIIIASHPSVALNEDGTLKILSDPKDIAKISELCKKNGIYFLDAGKKFLDEYEKDFALPYGFMNTSVGKGHMNKYGHRMFAEEIYKLIREVESQS